MDNEPRIRIYTENIWKLIFCLSHACGMGLLILMICLNYFSQVYFDELNDFRYNEL